MRPLRAIIQAAVIAAMVIAAGITTSGKASAGTFEVQAQVTRQIATYGGTQTAPGEVTYDSGAVKLVIPGTGEVATCPAGWYCFFQLTKYEGRMLQFRDCGTTQSLTDYGFGNRTTSWVNNTGHLVEVYDRDVDPFQTLWREQPQSRSSYVEQENDNRADFFYTYCGE